MISNEFLLADRIDKIQQIITKYGIDNFYVSFSGGKDSTVLSYLIDMAFPDNTIPRVYINTGIELKAIYDFVKNMSELDKRVVIIQPTKPIKETLEKYGYPFKSKMHSNYVKKYQKNGYNYKSVRAYTGKELTLSNRPMYNPCPKKLLYQFTADFNIKISDLCCFYLKEQPLTEWQKINNKPYNINGIMRSEGGRRTNSSCLSFIGKKLKAFQPLAPLDKEWEDWFIEKYNIKLCNLYYPPYNFTRTGCKGCPFALHLQEELDTLEKYFPAERKQCEYIWQPIYDEYRRINYRLKEARI